MAMVEMAVPAMNNGNNKPKAEAWANATFVDGHGNVHRMPVGMPLDSTTRVGKALVAKIKQDATFTLQMEVTFTVVSDEEIDFGF